MRGAKLLWISCLVGGRQLLAVVDELRDEIGLPAGKTVREEDGLGGLAKLRDLCGLLAPTLVAQTPLEPLALGNKPLGLDRVELLQDVRVGHVS